MYLAAVPDDDGAGRRLRRRASRGREGQPVGRGTAPPARAAHRRCFAPTGCDAEAWDTWLLLGAATAAGMGTRFCCSFCRGRPLFKAPSRPSIIRARRRSPSPLSSGACGRAGHRLGQRGVNRYYGRVSQPIFATQCAPPMRSIEWLADAEPGAPQVRVASASAGRGWRDPRSVLFELPPSSRRLPRSVTVAEAIAPLNRRH
jgi:hypothetical protein